MPPYETLDQVWLLRLQVEFKRLYGRASPVFKVFGFAGQACAAETVDIVLFFARFAGILDCLWELKTGSWRFWQLSPAGSENNHMPKPRAYTVPPASPLSKTVVSAASLRAEAEKKAKTVAAREYRLRLQAYATPTFEDDEDGGPLYMHPSSAANRRGNDEYDRDSLNAVSAETNKIPLVASRFHDVLSGKGPRTLRDSLLEVCFLEDIRSRFPLPGALTCARVRRQYGVCQRQAAVSCYLVKQVSAVGLEQIQTT